MQGFPQWLSGKESSAMQETQGSHFPSLVREDPLEEEMATQSGILA